MKTSNLFLTALVVTSLTFTSCSKSEDITVVGTTENGNGAVNNNGGGTVVITKTAVMSATIDGTNFTGFKPSGFPFTAATKLETFNSNKYLKIQGGDTASLIAHYELDLYIPEAQWKTGTFNLNEKNTDLGNGQNSFAHLTVLGRSEVYTTNTKKGTITITDYDTVNKKIKGTFELTYVEINNAGNSSAEYTVKNGSFEYSLDALK
jgi:hypothetical protein